MPQQSAKDRVLFHTRTVTAAERPVTEPPNAAIGTAACTLAQTERQNFGAGAVGGRVHPYRWPRPWLQQRQHVLGRLNSWTHCGPSTLAQCKKPSVSSAVSGKFKARMKILVARAACVISSCRTCAKRQNRLIRQRRRGLRRRIDGLGCVAGGFGRWPAWLSVCAAAAAIFIRACARRSHRHQGSAPAAAKCRACRIASIASLQPVCFLFRA